MKNFELEYLLIRIISGKLPFGDSFIYSPTMEQYQDACFMAHETVSRNDKSQDEQIEIYLKNSYEWNEGLEKQLKRMPKRVEDQKLKLYENFASEPTRFMLEDKIDGLLEEYRKLTEAKYQLFHITLDGSYEKIKWDFLIKKMWKEDGNYNSALNHYNQNKVSDKDLRSLVRSAVFQSFWNVSDVLFDKPVCELTEDQRRLTSWAKLYSSLSEAMDPPSEEVIEHDYALDGWLISQRRERKASRAKSKMNDQLSPKIASGDDIFVMTGGFTKDKKTGAITPQPERQDVYDMNDPAQRKIMKMNMDQVQKKGAVKDKEFIDRKIRIK